MDYLTGLVYSDFNFSIVAQCLRLLQRSRDVWIGTVTKTTEQVWHAIAQRANFWKLTLTMKVLQLRAKKGRVHRRCKPNALERNLSKMDRKRRCLPL